MNRDGCSQQTAGSGNLQPGPLPHIRKASAYNGSADHVHRSCSDPPEKNKGKMSGSILDQIANIFKSGKRKGDHHSGNSDLFRFRLKYQKIKEQRQKLHDFLHHRGNLRSGGKVIRTIKRGKKGIDISGKKTCPHSRKAEQKEFCLPFSHAQGGDQ